MYKVTYSTCYLIVIFNFQTSRCIYDSAFNQVTLANPFGKEPFIVDLVVNCYTI